jgi:hypothetical protein
MEELPKRRIWLPSLDFLVFMGVGVLIAIIAIPGLMSSQRASNERNASTSLKTLTSAEADFRANDRDWNHVNDFWTADVSGLYYLKSPDTGIEIKLLEERVANADAKPVFRLPHGTVETQGYFFQALERDDSATGTDRSYKVDTDKSGRRVHNEAKFGFCAFPKSGRDGKYIFFVNENNTIFRVDTSHPKEAFPSDQELKSYWSRMD